MEAARREPLGAAIYCRKSEIALCPMSNPSVRHAKSWDSLFGGCFRDGKSWKKKTFRKNPRNPLISLDSDERIQGNPSFSNPQNRGFS
jgi:hypothetical protein